MADDKQTEIHNEIVGDIVRSIVKPPLQAGGEFSSVLVVLESIVLGVMIVAERYGYGENALDEVVVHVKERLARDKLLRGEPAGHG